MTRWKSRAAIASRACCIAERPSVGISPSTSIGSPGFRVLSNSFLAGSNIGSICRISVQPATTSSVRP